MRCRRDYRDLTPSERARFIASLHHVKSLGVVDAFADEHNTHFSHGHNNSSFLPWHREFIRRFEAELQSYDPRVMLCYWNSSQDQSPTSGLWDAGFLGQFDAAWSLGRSLGAGGSLPSPNAVDTALNQPGYDAFRPDLENNVHNGPHNWVGGEMTSGRSPHDPVFFLHHCYIDMLWAQWQLRHPGAPFVADPGAPDVGDALDPWSTTVGEVLDHRTINIYSYPAGYIDDEPRVTPPPTSPPSVTFSAVPAGLTFLRPAIFQVDSCENLTFTIGQPVVDSGPAGTAFNRLDTAIVVDPHVEPTGRVWISYRGIAANDHATGHVDVTCQQTGDSWVLPITADVVDSPRAAIALLLDQSNSMNFESGIAPGLPRSAVLRFSAPPCIEVLDADHAATVISFDHDPHLLRGLTAADPTGRLQLNGAINSYAPNPQGWTAIGEAVNYAHGQLEPVTGFNIKATVVLTDGQENHGPYTRLAIGDVASLINESVFAIGLGTPANLQPATLQALCHGHDGYLLLTGDLNPDAYFRLAKYYQQIISGVTNQDIVLDPDGWVQGGQVVRIPFDLSETDITARAVLLTDNPQVVVFGLETPSGHIIEPWTSNPMVEFRVANAIEMYRVSLPLAIDSDQSHAGRWHALIGLIAGRLGLAAERLELATHAVSTSRYSARYSFSVHTYSNLQMRATLTQSSNEPGATIYLRAALTEYTVPLPSPAQVRAELVRPDETQSVVAFTAAEPGAYEASMVATQAGVYRFRIIAQGTTMHGRAFTREQTLTGAVWAGGDQPSRPPNVPGQRLCRLVRCLLEQRSVAELLRNTGVNPAEIARCLEDLCRRDDHESGPMQRLRALLQDDRALSIIAAALHDIDLPNE